MTFIWRPTGGRPSCEAFSRLRARGRLRHKVSGVGGTTLTALDDITVGFEGSTAAGRSEPPDGLPSLMAHLDTGVKKVPVSTGSL